MSILNFWKKPAGQKDAALYDRAKGVAQWGRVEDRQEMAANPDVPVELLYFFAKDESVEVRRSAALNPATPPQADHLLAKDDDTAVRRDLAHKVGQRMATQPNDADPELVAMVSETVETISSDMVTDIRAALAQEIRSLSNVPGPVVRRLAHDMEDSVCVPVLGGSPLLTDDDLVSALRGHTSNAVCRTIASRPGIGEAVSQAVVETGDVDSVRLLLTNETAEIHEDTMDTIVERAPRHLAWHDALANRSDLSTGQVQSLAECVSDALVERMIERYPLEADVKRTLKARVRARTAHVGAKKPSLQPQVIRVLVADDDASARSMIAALLKDLGGVRVTIVSGGDAALDILREHGRSIDLIVCDWHMPGSNGMDVLRHLRASGAKTPFVMVSGDNDNDLARNAEAHGADGFVPKPLGGQAFRAAVAPLIGR